VEAIGLMVILSDTKLREKVMVFNGTVNNISVIYSFVYKLNQPIFTMF